MRVRERSEREKKARVREREREIEREIINKKVPKVVHCVQQTDSESPDSELDINQAIKMDAVLSSCCRCRTIEEFIRSSTSCALIIPTLLDSSTLV